MFSPALWNTVFSNRLCTDSVDKSNCLLSVQELLKRLESGDLSADVLAREVLSLINASDKATIDNLITILLHSSVDFPRFGHFSISSNFKLLQISPANT